MASYVSARMNCKEMKLLLINPVTSYARLWDRVRTVAYQQPGCHLPLRGRSTHGPGCGAHTDTEIGQNCEQNQSTEDAFREINALQILPRLLHILPQDTLEWRLTEWLKKESLLEDRYDDITSSTLLLIGKIIDCYPVASRACA